MKTPYIVIGRKIVTPDMTPGVKLAFWRKIYICHIL